MIMEILVFIYFILENTDFNTVLGEISNRKIIMLGVWSAINIQSETVGACIVQLESISISSAEENAMQKELQKHMF